MNVADFKKIYLEEYEKLNTQQKRAVDTVAGPVMVIAGPGTGKTQILSRRVANIMTNHYTNPEEIVCLTYTEAGASEMLDRLEGLIGEEGRKVRVSTIHAFCSELILRNSEIFGGQPKIISTAAKYEILKEIMDEYVIEGNPLYKNSGKRYSAKDQLLELFYKMKRENLNKEDFEKEIDEYFKMIDLSVPGDELYGKFKYSQARNGKNLGDFKSNYDNEQQKMQKLLAGVEIVEKYSADISEHNYFDFDDMILWTIEKLEENDDFQRSVSDTIKYLFVDEFQDTSVVQNKLVDLLVKGKDNPNIFVVGDDDQSIYRFQGVSANNIRDFDKKYKPTKIVLDENYRSSQAIIDASRQLISHNPREEKLLIAAGANKDYDYQLPILKSYANAKAEMFGVLTEIKELIDSGVSPDEIGVIYGRNSYGEEFAKILRDNGIFVQMKENKDLFSEPFFKKIVAILKYLCQPSRNVRELRKIVYFDFFEVELSQIAMIRNLKKDEKILIPTIAEIDQKLEIIRKKVNKSSKYLSPMYVLSDVLKSLSIDEYIMKSKEKYHLVSVLNELYKLMLMECHIHPKLTVKGFLNQLSALKEMGISLPIENISGSPSNCVQLMTAHGSKGLEFDHVFIMKCNDGKKKSEAWPGGENNSGRFAYPPSLNGKDENESQLKEEENRRLFYVAMTRAKKVLHLSYSDDSTKTHFINEFEEFIDEVDVTESFDDFQSVDKVVIPKFSNNVINEIFDELSLSVSTLNAFLKCPLSFYFNKGLKLPSETNEAMVFGSIIHEVLEKIYISVDSSQSSELTAKTVLSPEEALKLFETIFEDKSYQLTSDRIKKDDYARGKKIIENLYKKAGYLKDGVVAVEIPIQGVRLGDILNTTVDLSEVSNIEINGKIDKIESEGNIVRLIDYKTGNAENGKKKLVAPSEKAPLGGDYWRQAVFYYILFKNAGIDISDKAILVKYVFVEDSNNEDGFSETEDIRITQSDVDTVLEQIKESIMKIKQGDYNCGCGRLKKDRDNYPCDYCLQVLANTAPKLDNTESLEVATYQQTRGNYKSLSVSKLNRFLSCPKSVYFDDVLQLSQPAGLSAGTKERVAKVTVKHAPTGPVFGTVIHETLEQIYKEDLQLEEAIEYYDNSLHSHQEEIIDTMSVEELKEYGHRLLTNLFGHYIPDSLRGKNVCLEKELRFKLGDKYSINGIIDKLEFDNNLIRVVDYKTGSAQRGIEELAVGRDYWRQSVFYNILLENSSEIDTNGKQIVTQYIFLDDDDAKEGYSIHTVDVTKEDMDIVLTQIQEFWDKVNSADFTGGCGKDDCDYCRLGKFVDFQLLKENVEVQSNKKN